MQVNDSSAAAPGIAATKDEVRAVGDAPENAARSRPGRRFRIALERKRDGSGPGANDSASAAAMAGWFRPESAAASTSRPGVVAGAPAARPVDRVLVGSGPDGAEARIRIGGGALAGTEIQLSSAGAGHIVEARLLTHAATSRQTLSLVMDEIRSRLRDRGIAFSTKAAGARSVLPPSDGDRSGEGDALARGEPGR